MKNALYVLRAKRHLLGRSNVKQWKNQARSPSLYRVMLVWRHQSVSYLPREKSWLCKTCKSSSKILAQKMSLFLQASCKILQAMQVCTILTRILHRICVFPCKFLASCIACKSLAVLLESCNWFLPLLCQSVENSVK